MKTRVFLPIVIATLALASCTTTEGQGSTDAFVKRELSKHGIQPDAAPSKTTAAPVS